jgi:hypothetical protein
MRTTTIAVSAYLILFAGGCGGFIKGKAAAENSIAHFHQQYSDGKLDDIWQEAHAKFRSASRKEQYDELMSAVLRKLGKVKSTSNAGWKVNSQNLTTTVQMTQKTVFEKGEGTESFTFEMNGGKAVLVGYNIQSMDLITK